MTWFTASVTFFPNFPDLTVLALNYIGIQLLDKYLHKFGRAEKTDVFGTASIHEVVEVGALRCS